MNERDVARARAALERLEELGLARSFIKDDQRLWELTAAGRAMPGLASAEASVTRTSSRSDANPTEEP